MQNNQENELVGTLTKAFDQIQNFEGIDFSDYGKLFLQFKKMRETTQNTEIIGILGFFEQILSMKICPNKKYEYVYTPNMLAQFCPSYMIYPECLSKEGLSVLRYCLDKVNNPFVKARIADILWINEHRHQYAQIAINSYEELLNDPGKQWYEIDEFAGRIVLIGKQKGCEVALEHLADVLENRIVESDQCVEEILWSCTYFLNAKMLNSRKTLFKRIIDVLSKNLAERDLTIVGNVERTFNLIRTVDVKICEMLCKLTSETLVRLGDASAERNSLAADRYYDLAMHFLNKYAKKSELSDEKKKEISQKRQNLRLSDSDSYSKVSEYIDVSKENEMAINEIDGSKDKWQAMAKFAFASSFSKSSLASHMEEAKQWVETYTILYQGNCRFNVDEFGVAIKCEDPVIAASFDKIKMDMEWRACAYLIPMLGRIKDKYSYDESEIGVFVDGLKEVPVEYKALFSLGLYRCLQGRYLETVYLLVPFFEGYVRRLFMKRRCSITHLQGENDQVTSLGNLIKNNKEEFVKLFGEENHFMVEALLTNPLGANLRNRVAHGNMFPNTKLMRYSVCAIAYIIRFVLENEAKIE